MRLRAWSVVWMVTAESVYYSLLQNPCSLYSVETSSVLLQSQPFVCNTIANIQCIRYTSILHQSRIPIRRYLPALQKRSFSLLQTLSTTVVELYTTASRDSDKWYYKDMGVLCLVKDNAKRSYFFRLFCLLKRQMTWEHEIYNNMYYLAPTSFLHTFEAEVNK